MAHSDKVVEQVTGQQAGMELRSSDDHVKQDAKSPRPDNADGNGSTHRWALAVALIIWFISSCLFNYLTPMLLTLVLNQDVTLLELVVTVSVGVVSLSARGLSLRVPKGTAHKWMAVGALHLLGCRAFIWGLQFMPVSLAQTIRASSPMVAVPIAVFLLGERYSFAAIASLVPIIIGFALSVGADGGDDSQMVGCVAAFVSVCCLVLVNAGCKRLGQEHHPFQVQFWTVLFALINLVPWWLSSGGFQRLKNYGGDVRWLAFVVLADGCLYYTEQVCQQQVLRALPLLPFTVIDTLRRLTIVCISGFLIQGNPCKFLNVCGITLVLFGGLAHNFARTQVLFENGFVEATNLEKKIK